MIMKEGGPTVKDVQENARHDLHWRKCDRAAFFSPKVEHIMLLELQKNNWLVSWQKEKNYILHGGK